MTDPVFNKPAALLERFPRTVLVSRSRSRAPGLDFTNPLLYTLFLGSEYAVHEYAVNPTEQREEKSCATTKEEEREWDRRDGCAPMVISRCDSGDSQVWPERAPTTASRSVDEDIDPGV